MNIQDRQIVKLTEEQNRQTDRGTNKDVNRQIRKITEIQPESDTWKGKQQVEIGEELDRRTDKQANRQANQNADNRQKERQANRQTQKHNSLARLNQLPLHLKRSDF